MRNIFRCPSPMSGSTRTRSTGTSRPFSILLETPFTRRFLLMFLEKMFASPGGTDRNYGRRRRQTLGSAICSRHRPERVPAGAGRKDGSHDCTESVKNGSLRDVQNRLGMREGFDIGLEMSGNSAAFREELDSKTCAHGGKDRDARDSLGGDRDSLEHGDFQHVSRSRAFTGVRCTKHGTR